jgi:hypothetical protein
VFYLGDQSVAVAFWAISRPDTATPPAYTIEVMSNYEQQQGATRLELKILLRFKVFK